MESEARGSRRCSAETPGPRHHSRKALRKQKDALARHQEVFANAFLCANPSCDKKEPQPPPAAGGRGRDAPAVGAELGHGLDVAAAAGKGAAGWAGQWAGPRGGRGLCAAARRGRRERGAEAAAATAAALTPEAVAAPATGVAA